MLRYRKLPIPLMLKMRSVTMAPPISAPMSMPMKVITGISEFRRVCTPTVRRLVSPLALAVRT